MTVPELKVTAYRTTKTLETHGENNKIQFQHLSTSSPQKIHGAWTKKTAVHPAKSSSAGWGEEEARLMDLDADQKVTFQDRDPAMKPMEPPIKQHCMG